MSMDNVIFVVDININMTKFLKLIRNKYKFMMKPILIAIPKGYDHVEIKQDVFGELCFRFFNINNDSKIRVVGINKLNK